MLKESFEFVGYLPFEFTFGSCGTVAFPREIFPDERLMLCFPVQHGKQCWRSVLNLKLDQIIKLFQILNLSSNDKLEEYEEHPVSNNEYYRTALGYMKNNVFVIGSKTSGFFDENSNSRIETFNIGDHAWKSRDLDGDGEFVCQRFKITGLENKFFSISY